jgi:hypothetical protein
MRLIYIVGTAHSGSTLLDLMLNAHPEIISVGEVLKINRPPKVRRSLGFKSACTCGAASLGECEFWSTIIRRIEDNEGKPLTDLNVQDYSDFDQEHAPNVVMFRAISEVSGRNFIVDSSKLPKRLRYLMQFDELDVYPIHIVRDAKGQIASILEMNGLFKGILEYELVHEQIRRMLKSVPHSLVRYEDLVLEPKRTLESILEPLGLKFDPQQLAWAEPIKHNIGGNHVRRQKTSTLVLDEKWKHRLSVGQKLAIEFGTMRSRRLFSKYQAITRSVSSQ